MDKYTATEQAYKNGYEKGYEAGKPKWIPVTKRLPLVAQNVLCFSVNGHIFNGAYLGADYKKGVAAFRDADRYYGRGVTHWMPLPEPPKEKDK